DALLGMATSLEGHPDNVTPALFGGVTVAYRSEKTIHHVKVAPPKGLALAVVVPDREVGTEAARRVLPPHVTWEDAVGSVQRAALLAAALAMGALGGLRPALADTLHQPHRAGLVAGLAEALAGADLPGLLGACLSGSGPSLLLFLDPSVDEPTVRASVERV